MCKLLPFLVLFLLTNMISQVQAREWESFSPHNMPSFPSNGPFLVKYVSDRGSVFFDGTYDDTYILTADTVKSLVPGIKSVCKDRNGLVYFLSKGQGIYTLDSKDSMKLHTRFNNRYMISFAIDSFDNMWILTLDTLYKLSGSKLTAFSTKKINFSYYMPCEMVIDKNGYIWIATAGKGLIKFDTFNWTEYNKSNSIFGCDTVYSLSIDKDNNIWAVSANPKTNNDSAKKIIRYIPGSGWTSYSRHNSDLPSANINALAHDINGDIWLGLEDENALIRFSKGRFKSIHLVKEQEPIKAIAIDRYGNKWISTYETIYAYRAGGLINVPFPVLPSQPALTAIRGSDYLAFSWKRNPDYPNLIYSFFKQLPGDTAIKAIFINKTDTSYLDEDLESNRVYYYAVQAYDTVTKRVSKLLIGADGPFYTIGPGLLTPPNNIKSHCNGNSIKFVWDPVIDLDWNPNLYFRLYCSDSPGKDYRLIKDRIRNEFCEYSDFKKDKRLYYVLTLYFAEDSIESIKSEEISIIIPGIEAWDDWHVALETDSLIFRDIAFADKNVGCAIGEKGFIMKTEDGGNNWKYKMLNENYRLNNIAFSGSRTGWITGLDLSEATNVSNNWSLLLKSSDGGNSWIKLNTDTIMTYTYVFFLDSLKGWLIGTSKLRPSNTILLKTNDGGLSWDTTEISYMQTFDKIKFINDNVGLGRLVTKYSYSGYYYSIYITSNCGLNWSYVTSNWSPLYFDINGTDIWIGAQDRYLSHSKDMGVTWTNKYLYWPINSMHFADKYNGWIGTTAGDILYTTDGSDTWQKVECQKTFKKLNGFFSLNNKNVWVVGDGVMLYTWTGGQKAINPQPPETVLLVSDSNSFTLSWKKSILSMFVPLVLYNVYRSSDNGGSWMTVNEKTADTFYIDKDDVLPETWYTYKIRTYMPGSDIEGNDSEHAKGILNKKPAPPVDLSYTVSGRRVNLHWKPGSPTAASYSIFRSTKPGSDYTLIEDTYMYTDYTDKEVPADGTYYYVVRSRGIVSNILSDESEELKVIVNSAEEQPDRADQTLKIQFDESRNSAGIKLNHLCTGRVIVNVYDALGRLVLADIFKGVTDPGFFEYSLSVTDFPAGIYYIKYNSCGKTGTIKIMLDK